MSRNRGIPGGPKPLAESAEPVDGQYNLQFHLRHLQRHPRLSQSPNRPLHYQNKNSKIPEKTNPGIITLIKGKITQLPSVTLVVGDTNNDNKLDVQDYSLLMGCYSDLLPAKNCTLASKPLSDLNDDTAVNQTDYNLFYRELSTNPAQ